MKVDGLGKEQEFILFGVGSLDFCFHVNHVCEVCGWSPIAPIAGVPSFVLGSLDLRGKSIPVIHLAKRIGLEVGELTPWSVIIVVQMDERMGGFLVDKVSEIISVGNETIRPIGMKYVTQPEMNTFAQGLIINEDKEICILSIEKLLLAPYSN